MTKEEFYKNLKNIGINLSNNQKEKFSIYLSYLQEYNKNVNLTAITREKDIYLKHFYDSIISTLYFSFSGKRVLDIGTGAGFPGVPLLICFPDIKLTLLDSNSKKTTFLERLKEKLNLNYNVITGRAEDLDLKECFDVVISRAVSNMQILLELSVPLLKVGGCLIAYKSNSEDELKDAKNALKKLDSRVISVNKTNILDNLRTIIIVEKLKKTNSIYPRNYNKIKKNPL